MEGPGCCHTHHLAQWARVRMSGLDLKQRDYAKRRDDDVLIPVKRTHVWNAKLAIIKLSDN